MYNLSVEADHVYYVGALTALTHNTYSIAFLFEQGIGFKTFEALKAHLGLPAVGEAWHHIVEQTASNVSRFGAEMIHNTANVIALRHGSSTIHEAISAFYSSIRPEITNSTTLTVRKWLADKSFEFQYEFGLQAIQRAAQGIR